MLLCQFLVLAGNRQFYYCGGKVLLRPEIKVLVVCLVGCAVVSVFGSGDCVSFWFWREIGSFFVVAGKFYYDRKKEF